MSYKYIDTSKEFDQEEDEDFAFILNTTCEIVKNGNPLKRAGLSKGVRDNNLKMVQEYLSQMKNPDVTKDIMQAAARGYDDLFCFLVQHHATDFCETSALEAAAYFGRVRCVTEMIPRCAHSAENWQIFKGIDAAIEGNQMHTLELLAPHANLKRHNSCVLRALLERDNYAAAEVIFPYINPSKAIADIKERATNERVKPMIKWIKQHLSNQKLKGHLEQAVAPMVQTIENKSGPKKM